MIPLAVLFLVLFCSTAVFAAATTATCPSGCSCLQPTIAREKGYDACGGQLSACGYDVYQKTMYCYKTPQLVLVPRTLQTLVIATTTAQPGTCPAGCSCMMESDAKEKFGSYSRCSETPCYSVVTGSTILKAYCFRQGTPPTTTTPVPACPQGCNCLSDAQAKDRYGTYTRCTDTVCGYDMPANMVAAYQVPKYCVKQGSTTPICPEGCNCITDAMAKQRYGDYTRCSVNVCGYEQDQTAKYCIKQGSTTPVCPEGCSCISDATAKARGGSWSRCSSDVCGYETSTATLAAVVQVPKYCMKQQETTTVCPEGCNCLTDAMAKQRYGTFTRCSADVCGYELSAATNALASNQIPKYCVKGGSTPVCPDGCACISDDDAKLKGLTERCDNSQTPCGYRTDTGTTTALRRIPLYCYKIPTTTSTCPEGCNCLSEAKAKERYGTYTRCSEEVCGKEIVPAANGVAAYSVPQYCVKQGSAPVCPEGCACISDEDAKLKGLTDRCDNSQTPCGYRTSTATATAAAQKIPLYCYKIPTDTTPVCPQGCYCLQEADAKLKFGPDNYTRCSSDICGTDPSATTANGIPKYCFKPTVTPTSPVCPQGCTCITNATGVEKGLTFCGGKVTLCGYNENKVALHCFNEASTPACVYDYQKNVCSGTCDQGYTCELAASKKDASGKVVYAACRCTGQPATPCAFDAQKNACTGTCQTGAACSVVGKSVDEKTGATTPVCGCPQQSACVYDYSKEACTGSCTGKGENCQLNTIYRDPASGKVTFAECHCKGGEVTETCACDATSGSCTGNCADGRACTMVERTTDNAGKVVCSKCECRDTCVLSANNECSGKCQTGEPCARIVYKDDNGNEKVSCGCGGISQAGGTPVGTATRQPGFFDGIASFFSKLFGGK